MGALTTSELAARTRFARDLAARTSELALRYFCHDIGFVAEEKGPQDWVSAADRAVEAMIRDAVAAAFPGDSVLGEEDGGTVAERLWVVDPVDGTINFVHGMRYWCISIAFVERGERRIGVISDPCAGETFWASRGEGAWCNDAPIRVSACASIERAMVGSGYVPIRHSLPRHLALRGALFDAGAAVKDMGAGALMLAHVAAGRFDAFAEPHMHPWDALAGLTLIEEAGGTVLPYPGSDLAAGGEVIAATPGIYAALFDIVRRC